MAVPAHTKVTFTGIFGTVANPQEQWSFSINYGPLVFATQGARESAADQASQIWTSQIGPMHPSAVRLQRVRVAQIDAGGLVDKDNGGAYNQGDYNTDLAGTGGSAVYPLQTSLCVSLVTDRAGASGKGRFFLPMPTYQINGTDFRLSAADVATAGGRAVALLQNVGVVLSGTATGPAGPPVVVSSKGFTTPVNAVRVGRVLDTMRSRRSDQAEGYVVTEF